MVASKYVISAAHCFSQTSDDDGSTTETPASDVIVWIGDHDLQTSGETSLMEKQIAVVSLTLHENYTASPGPWDLAVVELAEAVDLNTYTPACIAKSTDATTFDGKMATVVGWGITSQNGTLPDPLVPYEVQLRIVPCPVPHNPSDICAGGEEGKDSCQVK